MADELERALLLRDLELMGQPRNPNAVQPGRAGLLDVGVGLPERLSLLNQIFNPVEAIGQSMKAGGRMMSPNMGVMDRLAALGDMASGIAGVVAPVAAASRAGTPAATALMEGLLGGSPTQQAATDMARGFVTDESGALRLYQGSPHNFAAERLVRMPDGSTQYIVGRPDVLPDVPAGAGLLRDFPLGRQRMDKIGTGEGAQAYGYGLYGAENESVGRGYRDALAGNKAAADLAKTAIRVRGGDRARAAEMLRGEIAQSGPDPELLTALEIIESGRDNLGYLYELEVNANPEDFLDWDKPISQQSEKLNVLIGDRLEKFLDLEGPMLQGPFDRFINGEMTGEEAYRLMNPQAGIDKIDWTQPIPKQASDALLAQGIPGIRYLDEGSRSKPYVVDLGYKGKPFEEGYFEPQFARSKEEAESIAREYQGKGYDANVRDIATRNYVIFDENLINIVRKYGIAGAAAMLGVSAFDVEQAMAQGQQQPQGLLSAGVQ